MVLTVVSLSSLNMLKNKNNFLMQQKNFEPVKYFIGTRKNFWSDMIFSKIFQKYFFNSGEVAPMEGAFHRREERWNGRARQEVAPMEDAFHRREERLNGRARQEVAPMEGAFHRRDCKLNQNEHWG